MILPSRPASTSSGPDRLSVAFALVLFALTVITYLPALSCAYIWDDGANLTNNPTLRSLDGLRRIWFEVGAVPQYYPLVYTSFWVEYHLWGLSPFGYHAVNVLLHSLNAVLLWRVLSRLAVPGAWAAAAVFAVHPVHVESVAWIAERKNVLSGAFYLGAALLYLTSVSPPTAPDRRSRRPYLLALFLFIGALFSKTITASLPVVLAIVVWWKRRELRRLDLLLLSPMVVLGVAMGLLTVWLESYDVGAAGQAWSVPWSARPLAAGRALWFYLAKLAWPHPLIFIYPRSVPDPSHIGQYLPLVAALGVLVALWWLRERIGRGVLIGVLYFVVTLTPALGFFDVYFMRFSLVADHFNYLASIGPITLAVAFAATRFGLGSRGRIIGLCCCSIVLVSLGGLSWKQERLYRDEETLWRGTLARNPEAFLAHNNLGGILLRRGQVADAEEHFQAALRIESSYPHALSNLGDVRRRQGRIDEAVVLYRAALENDPDLLLAHNNLGTILLQRGQTDQAEGHFQAALRVKSDYAEALNNMGQVRHRQGRLDEAMTYCREALRHDPLLADAHNNLGIALAAQGTLQDAVAEFAHAIRIRPSIANAHYNLGVALVATGKRAEGVAHLEEAARLNPGDPDTARELAAARVRLVAHRRP